MFYKMEVFNLGKTYKNDKREKPYFNGKTKRAHMKDVKREEKKEIEYYLHIDGFSETRFYDQNT